MFIWQNPENFESRSFPKEIRIPVGLEALKTRSVSEASPYEFANLQGLIQFKCIPTMFSQTSWSGAQAGLLTTPRIPSTHHVGSPASPLVTEMLQIGGQGLGSSLPRLSAGFLSSSLYGSLPRSISSAPGNLTSPTHHPLPCYQSSICKGHNRSRCSPFPRLVAAWSCIQDTRGSPHFPLPALPVSALKRWPLIPFDIHDFVPSALSTWVTVVVLCWGRSQGLFKARSSVTSFWAGGSIVESNAPHTNSGVIRRFIRLVST